MIVSETDKDNSGLLMHTLTLFVWWWSQISCVTKLCTFYTVCLSDWTFDLWKLLMIVLFDIFNLNKKFYRIFRVWLDNYLSEQEYCNHRVYCIVFINKINSYIGEGAVVAQWWTADQQFKQLILHLWHDSYQTLSLSQLEPNNAELRP